MFWYLGNSSRCYLKCWQKCRRLFSFYTLLCFRNNIYRGSFLFIQTVVKVKTYIFMLGLKRNVGGSETKGFSQDSSTAIRNKCTTALHSFSMFMFLLKRRERISTECLQCYVEFHFHRRAFIRKATAHESGRVFELCAIPWCTLNHFKCITSN